jgi:hypothetical protein
MSGFQAEVARRHQKREGSGMRIRQLHSGDAALYREIRLEALRLHPEAFGSSFAREAAQPLAFFTERLVGNAIFGGWRDGVLAGTAAS